MAELEFLRADAALVSDLGGHRVEIPCLTVFTPKAVNEVALVRFEGNQKRTGFRGEGQALTLPMTAHYSALQHPLLAELVDLFELARVDGDGRILFRSHLSDEGPLNFLEAVLITDYQETWGQMGAVDFAFTAESVDWSPAV